MSVFRLERGCYHADVDPIGDGLDDRNDEKQAWALKGAETAEAQHNGPLPLVRDIDGVGDDACDNNRADRNQDAFAVGGRAIGRISKGQADAEDDNENQRW